MDGQDIQLTLIEYVPYPPYEREAIMLGKRTPSGQVKFSLSPPLTDFIEMHIGCEIYGGPRPMELEDRSNGGSVLK